METIPLCSGCGKPLPPSAPKGLCPECLLKAGFPTGSQNPGAGPGQRQRFIPPTREELAGYFPQLEIIELIGQGGMGAVYKARQPALDRLVALKILPPQSGTDTAFAERFAREARALARLNHPNIVAVYDFGQVQCRRADAGIPAPPSPSTGIDAIDAASAGSVQMPYFLMEYVDGPNLRQIQLTAKLTPAQALQVIPQICDALQFAHNSGIVHRDIKPENILLDRAGRVKIADFGIAKLLDQPPHATGLTGARDVIGTPHYMAPEQIEKPQEVDHRADIYSLGVVFYEMLTGELPLGKFQPPSRKVQVDVRLDEVVLQALEKEPARRYQQASQVKTAVESISTTPCVASAPAGSPPPFPSPTASNISDKTILPAFLLAFLFGVFGAHRFYVGKIGTAVLQLATFGACGIWSTIDWILLLCKAFTDKDGKRLANWVNPSPSPNGSRSPASGGSTGTHALIIAAIAVFALLAILTLVGLATTFVGYNTARGTGRPSTEYRPVADFSRINLSGAPNVEVQIAPSNSVSVTTDENLLGLIETQIEGDTLQIGSRGSYSSRRGVLVRVTTPTLESATLAGSGNMEIEGIDSPRLEMRLSGSGTARLEGTVEELQVVVAGSGNVRAQQLKARDAVVTISGSGNVSVHSTNSLNAAIYGSGDIRYSGRPETVQPQITGSGSVRPE